MKILFTHDHKFCRTADGIYLSDGQFPYRLWQRYLEVFDEIVVAARVRAPEPGEDLSRLDVSSGPKVSFVEIPSLSNPVAMFTKRREAAGRLRQALAGCDGLIARISEISLLAAEVADELNKPWLTEVVYCPFDSLWNYGNWQGKMYAHYSAYKTARMTRRAPFAVYVTREFLQRRYPCAGRILSCSDVQLIKSNEDVLTKRLEKIRGMRDSIRIGLVGSLSRYKGIDTALQAVRLLRQEGRNIQLAILGGGKPDYWEQLADKNNVRDITEFCGVLPNGEAVNTWLDAVDIYIQPSYQEGLPRALVEAMNRGCPAVGSSAGGIPELLAPEWIHRPGDSQGLAGLLGKMIEERSLLATEARRNFQEASKYDKGHLDQIRQDFWREFIDYAKSGVER